MNQRPASSRVQHGDPTCANYGCRREECLKVRADKRKRNRYLLATGRPGFVPAKRARARLEKFRAAGYQDKEIMALVGVGRTTYYRVMRDEPITRGSETKILSVPVPPAIGTIRTTCVVDATGTHRRLQALIWLGWPQRELESRLGVFTWWVDRTLRHQVGVRLALANQVTRLYDALWSVRPEDEGVDSDAAEAARQYARNQSWVGPLAWDDDTIGDPQALPATDAEEPVATEGGNVAARWLMGESVTLGRNDRREVLAHLYEWTNDTTTEIAGRLNMTPAAAERQWERIKERAAAEGRRVWRRVYVPRERDLKQNEMGEAA